MPAFVAALLDGLILVAGSIAGRVLVSLGYALLTYTGLMTTMTWLKTEAVAHIQALPPEVVGMLGLLKVGSIISIITSAIATRMLLDGLRPDGSITKLIRK